MSGPPTWQQQQQWQQPLNNAPGFINPQQSGQLSRHFYQGSVSTAGVPASNQALPQYYDRHLTLRTYSDGSIDLFFHDDVHHTSESPGQAPKEDVAAQQSPWQKIDWTPIFQTMAEKLAEEGTSQLIEGGRAGVKKLVIRGSTLRTPRGVGRKGQDHHRQPRHPQNVTNVIQDSHFLEPNDQKVRWHGDDRRVTRSRSNPSPHRVRRKLTPPPLQSASPRVQAFPDPNARFQRSLNHNVFPTVSHHDQFVSSEISSQGTKTRGRRQHNQSESPLLDRRPGTASTAASKKPRSTASSLASSASNRAPIAASKKGRSRASSPASHISHRSTKVPSVSTEWASTVYETRLHKR